MKNKHIVDGRYLDHSYVPDNLPGREKQIEELSEHLCDCYVKSRNAVIMGDRGTGKTAVAKKICTRDIPEQLNNDTKTKENLRCKGILVNCKQSNTRFKVYEQMLYRLTGEWHQHNSEQAARMHFLSEIDDLDSIIVVLDETDMLKKGHTDILYDFGRFRENDMTNCRVTVIAISNDTYFLEKLDSKSRSSLCQAEFIFEPYDAHQLQKILTQRAKKALVKNSWNKPIISRIAALAAQEEGDARYAIWMLSQAAEIAGRLDKDRIDRICVRRARRGVEEERVRKVIGSLVFQKRILLEAVAQCHLNVGNNGGVRTREVIELYRENCGNYGANPRSDRSIRSFLGDLENLGILNKEVISRGRYGRTQDIKLNVPVETIMDVMSGDNDKDEHSQKTLGSEW